ncbi:MULTISPECIES: hypothetical protein [unclassified Imperialibacter]|uniref:hypothetical protein n=1 Tax=unclassified Imperialibacter TaxID=2629706 RepID=UPI001250F7E0|nr:MULTISPECIES: hypothetical protein [unclassified Imperialibacter]CAD5290036.1 hypothetical protein IMPERIA89_60106 [Imperialibacter sp. 89]CAD5290316.1 hypothetical protein IMPERIA75_630104 [Imperialibacter sp. 75]VVT34504.1 hypothetical protein IMPR6_70145 [Imperialibacter sp. EC-SDR9]
MKTQIPLILALVIQASISFGQKRHEFPLNFQEAQLQATEARDLLLNNLSIERPTTFPQKIERRKGFAFSGRVNQNANITVKVKAKSKAFSGLLKQKFIVYLKQEKDFGPKKIKLFEERKFNDAVLYSSTLQETENPSASPFATTFVKYEYFGITQ